MWYTRRTEGEVVKFSELVRLLEKNGFSIVKAAGLK